MVNKGIVDDIKIVSLLDPVSVAATADLTRADTAGYESCLIVMHIGALDADPDWVITIKDNDTGTSTAGTAVDGSAGLMRWGVGTDDDVLMDKFDADGVMTLTNQTADQNKILWWEYYGGSRYVGPTITSADNEAGLVSVTAIMSHARYQGRDGLHKVTE